MFLSKAEVTKVGPAGQNGPPSLLISPTNSSFHTLRPKNWNKFYEMSQESLLFEHMPNFLQVHRLKKVYIYNKNSEPLHWLLAWSVKIIIKKNYKYLHFMHCMMKFGPKLSARFSFSKSLSSPGLKQHPFIFRVIIIFRVQELQPYIFLSASQLVFKQLILDIFVNLSYPLGGCPTSIYSLKKKSWFCWADGSHWGLLFASNQNHKNVPIAAQRIITAGYGDCCDVSNCSAGDAFISLWFIGNCKYWSLRRVFHDLMGHISSFVLLSVLTILSRGC